MMPDATTAQAFDLKDMAILLDVDGTLIEIAPTPRAVNVPEQLRQTLARLWERTDGALALVSGRTLSELDFLFSPLVLPSVGGHGAEFRLEAGGVPEHARLLPIGAEVKRLAADFADANPGVMVEDKGYSLALHYRLAPEKALLVRDAAASIQKVANAPLELLPGKAMIEIKQVGFNKGSAVRDLMSHSPFAGRRPLFIGDDVTDMDVFPVLSDYRGIAISVGERLPGVQHCFKRPEDVRRWLADAASRGAFVLP
jgi:trehalose 6-phosphate phosphatase